jgi:hypothetical protein
MILFALIPILILGAFGFYILYKIIEDESETQYYHREVTGDMLEDLRNEIRSLNNELNELKAAIDDNSSEPIKRMRTSFQQHHFCDYCGKKERLENIAFDRSLQEGIKQRIAKCANCKIRYGGKDDAT